MLKSWVASGRTYKEISEELQLMYPQRRGFSVRSVRRHVNTLGIKSAIQQDTQQSVQEAIDEVRSMPWPWVRFCSY